MFRPTLARLAGAASKAKPVWQGADHPVARIEAAPLFYRICAKGLGASMWFFLLYRAKEDGPALIGLKHPWDH